MDSLTQMVLGGAVVGAIVGRKYGRKAVLVGAICGTLPDLDVFIPYGDDLSNMVEHRGFSHSLIILTFFAPLMTWLFSKIKYFGFDRCDVGTHIAIWLALITHALLDAMTIYGTQLLWPITDYPFGIGSVFIIDPLYTLPLLFALAAFLVFKNQNIVRIGLVLTSAYLLWSVLVQHHVTNLAKQSLQDTQYNQILSLPTAFNTLLWRVLVTNNDGYRVGYYSLFDDSQTVTFNDYDNEIQLPDSNDAQRLSNFTKGFYNVIQIEDKVIMQDVRMGMEPDHYVFQFIMAQINDGKVMAVPNQQYKMPRNTKKRLAAIWNRIWDQDARIYEE
jgi:inner membrane protein